MKDVIKKVVDAMGVMPWMWIIIGIIGAVFLLGLILSIIKKRPLAVGRSTALATLLGYFIFVQIYGLKGDFDGVYYALFILALGSVLALIGGFIGMLMKKKCKKHEHTDFDYSAPAPVDNGYDAGSDFAYNADTESYPAVRGGAASPDVSALLSRIDIICTNGAPLAEMREAAMQLQKERAKPENKNNPAVYSKLNSALINLLNAIQKR